MPTILSVITAEINSNGGIFFFGKLFIILTSWLQVSSFDLVEVGFFFFLSLTSSGGENIHHNSVK